MSELLVLFYDIDCIDPKVRQYLYLHSLIVSVRDNWKISPPDSYLFSWNISQNF